MTIRINDVCAFSFSASSIKTADLPGSRRKKVREYAGSQLIDIIKDFCLFRFPDFARYLLVDAYNEPAVIGFYQKNKFTAVFSTEEQEKKSYRQPLVVPLQTRYMFYDLIKWRDKM